MGMGGGGGGGWRRSIIGDRRDNSKKQTKTVRCPGDIPCSGLVARQEVHAIDTRRQTLPAQECDSVHRERATIRAHRERGEMPSFRHPRLTVEANKHKAPSTPESSSKERPCKSHYTVRRGGYCLSRQTDRSAFYPVSYSAPTFSVKFSHATMDTATPWHPCRPTRPTLWM